MTEIDVLVVGAGLSGIGAAYRLKTELPHSSFVVLEANHEIGGTWTLFRYPGVRSDSDMFTFVFPWKPWRAEKSIADGATILEYLRDSVREHELERYIRFGHRVTRASWSSATQRWTVEAKVGDETRLFGCRFLYACSGYYSYDRAHAPSFEGQDRFGGRIVHPQWWPAGLEVKDKRIVVVGSGATAITLVPALAKDAAHVTMLQRSPTYVATLPSDDGFANLARALLPRRLAHHLARIKNVLVTMAIYALCRAIPVTARRMLLANVRAHLPPDFDVEKHFGPRYAPWDQRLCLAPDADLFIALRRGNAVVETDSISHFTEGGVVLASGRELAADIVVTATGLELLAIGGMELSVDDRTVSVGETMVYKGTMLGDVPNFAWCVGYINASWGLRADLASRYVCRLLDFMERHGYASAIPRVTSGMETRPVLDVTAGYVQRGAHRLPKQGTDDPWLLRQNYLRDYMTMRFGRVDDEALELTASLP